MTRSRRARGRVGVAVVAALAFGLASGGAGADPSQKAKGKGGPKGGGSVPVNVMVVHTSDGEGGVDPRARELDARLKKQLRYKSMRVMSEERVNLRVDEVGTIPLPDGRSVRVRPMHRDRKGVLMAVDVEGAVKLDARAANRHRVVIGAGEYEDGNLAVSIEPDYED